MLYLICSLILLFILAILFQKKIDVGIWSISVFDSQSFLSLFPDKNKIIKPTLQASDVTDAPAEFVADPFIISDNQSFYLFFEILDKSTDLGIIGLAKSEDGIHWIYDRVVLKEDFHLSYPYVFKHGEEFYMIPESSQANQIILYKALDFPYKWDRWNGLIQGKYVDPSIFQYNQKWWMFAAKGGKLHLFFSDRLQDNWVEHPKSPLITDNNRVTRPGGRVIVDGNVIYRYAQDGKPTYGSAVRVFKVKELSETEYQEIELGTVLAGSKKENKWNRDGMHTIDQLQIDKNKWFIAVDGHKLNRKKYLLWKLDRILAKARY